MLRLLIDHMRTSEVECLGKTYDRLSMIISNTPAFDDSPFLGP